MYSPSTSVAKNEIKSIQTNSEEDNAEILLLESKFPNRLPTVFFPYPDCCGQIRNTERTIRMDESFKLKFKLSESVHSYNCILRALKAAGFQQTEKSNWNLIWSAPLNTEYIKGLSKYQRCNHFPGTWELGRKDNLWRNISKYNSLKL